MTTTTFSGKTLCTETLVKKAGGVAGILRVESGGVTEEEGIV